MISTEVLDTIDDLRKIGGDLSDSRSLTAERAIVVIDLLLLEISDLRSEVIDAAEREAGSSL